MEEKHGHEEGHESHNKHHMNVFDCIRSRRSIRKYKDKQVPWDNIVEIMQSAKFAPFAGNIMPCKLIVVKNEGKKVEIAEACSQQYWMQDAPIHIVIVYDTEKVERYYGTRGVRLYGIQEIGAAIQNMLLTAHTLGLGACWIGTFDEDEIRRLCNLPEHVNVQAIITIGYSDEHPEPPPKNRVEHIMYFEKWWGRVEPPKTGLGHWSPYFQKSIQETGKMIKKAVGKAKNKIKKKKEGKK